MKNTASNEYVAQDTLLRESTTHCHVAQDALHDESESSRDLRPRSYYLSDILTQDRREFGIILVLGRHEAGIIHKSLFPISYVLLWRLV